MDGDDPYEPVFSFPFTPYSIQTTFMKELYFALEKGRLGIFESPTGTGKSLSICCGALTWLKNYNVMVVDTLDKDIKQMQLEVSSNSSNDDWLNEEYEKVKKKQMLAILIAKLNVIKKREELYSQMKDRVTKLRSHLNKKIDDYCPRRPLKTELLESQDQQESEDALEDKDLILAELENEQNYSSDEEESSEREEVSDLIKIYISSRTHSQLSQFVGEIKRTVFNNNIRLVTLASRQHFCINSDVVKLKNVNLINERCLDMQKSTTKVTAVSDEGKALKKTKTKSCAACPYYNQSNISRLKERLLVNIMDMEDLVNNGKELKACPYYASRMALEDAQVVLISHAGIVSAGARSGVSIKLENNVLILDEAHGLTAALESAHSAPVSSKQLSVVKTFLHFYINKYRARLSSKNLLSLNQIHFVIGKLHSMTKPCTEDTKKVDETVILTLEDFVIKTEIDHMNLRPLVEFCRATRLAPKLHGFSMRYNQQALEEDLTKTTQVKKSTLEQFLKNMSKKKEEVQEQEKVEDKPITVHASPDMSAGSGLYAILDFLDMLCARSENGRVLVQKGSQSGQLKYLLLNPAEQFTEVVKQCRSVIVAGGTMEPISEFRALLRGNKLQDDENISVVRCDHVVSPENVLGICLTKGPSNLTLNFSFENRNSKQLLDEVGRILRNVCNIVPGGVICFLPSYSYEQTIYEHLANTKVIEIIGKKKELFREPKSAADVDQVLNKFASAVKCKDNGRTGALLLSVVGGKLSEGLNFSDDLGRCVIVLGMPYPNVKSPELQEKLSYVNRTVGGGAGNLYYENLCMKAVNQCIGRAVRHANDYACVMLVDDRYSRSSTISSLPSFVQKSLMANCNFGQTIGSIAKFFSRHKGKT